mmetsp:Transcript_29742/g.94791  ORF Transcript_29742/g.94791 Transcript_29742/m.94791 type:complete len:213 (-) Transcript_29742:281-919(-)
MGWLQSSWSSTRGGSTANSASMSLATSKTPSSPSGSYCAWRSRSTCASAVLFSTAMPLWKVRAASIVWIAASGSGSPVSTCREMDRSVGPWYSQRSRKKAGKATTSDSRPLVPATRPIGCSHRRCLRARPTVWKTFLTSGSVSSTGRPSSGGARSQTMFTAGRLGPCLLLPRTTEYSWILCTQKPSFLRPRRRCASRKKEPTSSPVPSSRTR